MITPRDITEFQAHRALIRRIQETEPDPARWPALIAEARGESPPAESSGILRQAARFITASIQHAAAGLPILSPEATAARLAICATCPLFDHDQVRCRACGCHLQIKASWADQDCPQGKWPRPQDSSTPA